MFEQIVYMRSVYPRQNPFPCAPFGLLNSKNTFFSADAYMYLFKTYYTLNDESAASQLESMERVKSVGRVIITTR